jgi:hypothetical protein
MFIFILKITQPFETDMQLYCIDGQIFNQKTIFERQSGHIGRRMQKQQPAESA